MDQKDKIILQQLDVIRSMTENSMKRMNSDFWGTPAAPQPPAAPKAPEAAGKGSEKKAAVSTGQRRARLRKNHRLPKNWKTFWRNWIPISVWTW